MTSKKYGNDHFWCFLDENPGKEVAIWRGPDGAEEIIARATDKYEAKQIVDALLNHVNVEDKTKFGKKEMAFLEFACSNFVEPYATMASNAIIWNDHETYNSLKRDFPTIYS